MCQIYESAAVTFAWLSSSDSEISRGIDLLKTAYDMATRYATQPLHGTGDGAYWVDDIMPFYGRVDWEKCIPAILAVHPFERSLDGPGSREPMPSQGVAEPWASLQRMFHLPYWNRIWVVQEAIVSCRYYLVSPSAMIDYIAAQMALEAVHWLLCEPMERDARHAADCSIIQTLFVRDMRTLLSFLLRRLIGCPRPELGSSVIQRCNLLSTVFMGSRLSSNPLDQVYSVIGYTGMDIVPDYRAPVGRVYLDFAHRFVQEMGSPEMVARGLDDRLGLSFLAECAAGVGNTLDLPSWAPAFSLSSLHDQKCFLYGSKLLLAPLQAPQQRIVAVGRSLWTSAAQVQPIIRRRAAGTHYVPNKETVTLLEDVLASYGPRYLNGMSTVEALCRVLRLQGEKDVDLVGLAAVFRLGCEWTATSGLLYEQLEPSLARLRSLMDTDTDQQDRVLALLGRFISDWASKHIVDVWSFQLIETAGGYLGLAGEAAREGDVVCMLKGCFAPVLLRPEDDHFLFVGPCFVLGLMEDEILGLLEAGLSKIEVVEIR